MNPITAYISAIKQPFNYSGTASRLEYWMCVVGFIVLSFIVGLVLALIGVEINGGAGGLIGLILWLFLIVLPSLSLAGRRLNDIGWPVWLVILCILFPIFFIIIGIVPGNK